MLFLLLRGLRHRWAESLLTIVAVAVPVAALTVQRSLSASTEDQIHAQAHDLGNNMLVLSDQTELADYYAMRYDDSGMSDAYPDRIASGAVGQHIGFIESRLTANVEIRREQLVFMGANLTSGGRTEPWLPPDVVALGGTAAARLESKASDGLRFRDLDLQVSQVLNSTPEGLDVGIFSSLETAQKALDRYGQINSMRLGGCWCSLDVPALAEEVEAFLPGTQALTVSGMLKAQKGTISQAKRYSKVSSLVAVLLIAAIVMALITSQVRRQIREIGLLLATGALPVQILTQFVVKAGLLGALGGLLGHVLGRPLTEIVAAALVGLPLPASADLMVPTVILSTLICALAALIPALRAARLDPTEVLRDV